MTGVSKAHFAVALVILANRCFQPWKFTARTHPGYAWTPLLSRHQLMSRLDVTWQSADVTWQEGPPPREGPNEQNPTSPNDRLSRKVWTFLMIQDRKCPLGDVI